MGRNPQRECTYWPIVPDIRADWELKTDTLKMWLGFSKEFWSFDNLMRTGRPCSIQDLRFSQCCCSGFKCPGVWCCVVWVCADISKDQGAFIFSLKINSFSLDCSYLKMKALQSLAVPGATHPVTWCHIHDTWVLSNAIGFLKTVWIC
jgi:hypothetical protein